MWAYLSITEKFPKLKRKRAALRSNISKFATAINEANKITTPDDLEHYCNRLQETFLAHITKIDYSIHGSLNEVKYATYFESYEEYIDAAKRTIYKTSAIDYWLLCPLCYILCQQYPLRLQSISKPTSWKALWATFSLGIVFGSRFIRAQKTFCLTD